MSDELNSLLQRQIDMIRQGAASRVDPLEREKLDRLGRYLGLIVLDGVDAASACAQFLDEAMGVFGTMRYAKGAVFSCGWAAEALDSWFTNRNWAEEAIRESDKCASWYLKTIHSKDIAWREKQP